jgi:hypothetical protein
MWPREPAWMLHRTNSRPFGRPTQLGRCASASTSVHSSTGWDSNRWRQRCGISSLPGECMTGLINWGSLGCRQGNPRGSLRGAKSAGSLGKAGCRFLGGHISPMGISDPLKDAVSHSIRFDPSHHLGRANDRTLRTLEGVCFSQWGNQTPSRRRRTAAGGLRRIRSKSVRRDSSAIFQ